MVLNQWCESHLGAYGKHSFMSNVLGWLHQILWVDPRNLHFKLAIHYSPLKFKNHSSEHKPKVILRVEEIEGGII